MKYQFVLAFFASALAVGCGKSILYTDLPERSEQNAAVLEDTSEQVVASKGSEYVVSNSESLANQSSPSPSPNTSQAPQPSEVPKPLEEDDIQLDPVLADGSEPYSESANTEARSLMTGGEFKQLFRMIPGWPNLLCADGEGGRSWWYANDSDGPSAITLYPGTCASWARTSPVTSSAEAMQSSAPESGYRKVAGWLLFMCADGMDDLEGKSWWYVQKLGSPSTAQLYSGTCDSWAREPALSSLPVESTPTPIQGSLPTPTPIPVSLPTLTPTPTPTPIPVSLPTPTPVVRFVPTPTPIPISTPTPMPTPVGSVVPLRKCSFVRGEHTTEGMNSKVCSGNVLAQGSMFNQDSLSSAAQYCSAADVQRQGSCCSMHLFGEGEWFLTDGVMIAEGGIPDETFWGRSAGICEAVSASHTSVSSSSTPPVSSSSTPPTSGYREIAGWPEWMCADSADGKSWWYVKSTGSPSTATLYSGTCNSWAK